VLVVKADDVGGDEEGVVGGLSDLHKTVREGAGVGIEKAFVGARDEPVTHGHRNN
jgi:hypothetical protein